MGFQLFLSVWNRKWSSGMNTPVHEIWRFDNEKFWHNGMKPANCGMLDHCNLRPKLMNDVTITAYDCSIDNGKPVSNSNRFPIKYKLAPYGTGGRLLFTANFKVTRHKNLDKSQKFGPDKL